MPALARCALLCLIPSVALMAADNDAPPASMTEYWSPVPSIVEAKPGQAPSDAIVLFDGSSLDTWELASAESGPAPWDIVGDAMVVPPHAEPKVGRDIRTKQKFGDVQLHIEWRSPAKIVGHGQGRGNSGIFFMDRYEVQILDNHDNPTYVNGQVGSIYKQQPPC
ncbi:MAG: DUF1080 domain-containing protein [Candidatus Synoicihabitans palmerolidicus]|nr:DUF1080 domain-containing protein [Candidatus Synoicihabitans palmerolidicus]